MSKLICHYITHKGDKILIPMCWPVVHTNDKSRCTCNYGQADKEKWEELEKRIEKLEKKLL